MRIEADIKDPRYKVGDLVLSIYMGAGYISTITSASVNLHDITNKPINDEANWCYKVRQDNQDRLISERDVYLLQDILNDINEFGVNGAADKRRIDISYIEMCNKYTEDMHADWAADGRAEALSS